MAPMCAKRQNKSSRLRVCWRLNDAGGAVATNRVSPEGSMHLCDCGSRGKEAPSHKLMHPLSSRADMGKQGLVPSGSWPEGRL